MQNLGKALVVGKGCSHRPWLQVEVIALPTVAWQGESQRTPACLTCFLLSPASGKVLMSNRKLQGKWVCRGKCRPCLP